MSGTDLQNLIDRVFSANSIGEDLAYTPEFQQMLDALDGQPERVMGDSVIPAVEPEWNRAISLGTDLLSQSKDIRIAVALCRALLQTDGFPGLDAGITVTHRLLSDYWDNLYPKLDPDDNNDPTERTNALLNLCDRDAFLNPLRKTPLVHSRLFGSVCLRDIEIARGGPFEPAGTDGQHMDEAAIDAAFLECDIEQLLQTAATVANAAKNAEDIQAILTDRIGATEAPDLAPLLAILVSADKLLRARVEERKDSSAEELAAPSEEEVSGGAGETMPIEGAPTVSAGRGNADISSREDVVRMLDKLCDYYVRNEPSSPVPMLLQRARRLVTKDFMGIVQDLAPDAIAQIEAIRGTEGDNS